MLKRIASLKVKVQAFELQIDNPKKRIMQSGKEQSTKRTRKVGKHEIASLMQSSNILSSRRRKQF